MGFWGTIFSNKLTRSTGQPQSLLAAACCDHAETDSNPVSSYEQYKFKTY